MNVVSRMFCYPVLERELTNRLADRDKTIEEQKQKIEELEDRLFIRFGLPPKGVDFSANKGVVLASYRSGRQRVRDMVTPPVVTLSEEEEKRMDESLTQ